MKHTLLSAALVASSAVAAQAVPIVNSSFETIPGPLNGAGWALFDGIEGWTASGGRIEVQSAPTLPFIDAIDGNNYVELHSDGLSTITQSLFLAAGSYSLSFFYSLRSNTPGENDMSFSVSGLLDGLVVDAPTADFQRGEWTEIGASFDVTTAGTYDLSFSALPGSNNLVGALIDDISLEMAPVPVPAAGLMLLTALGGAMALRRKKA